MLYSRIMRLKSSKASATVNYNITVLRHTGLTGQMLFDPLKGGGVDWWHFEIQV